MKEIILIILLFKISFVFSTPLLLFDGYSAKSFGLASTGVASKGDINSVLINPASTASIKFWSISSSLLLWYADSSLFNFNLAVPNRYGRIAFSLYKFSIENIPNYDINGTQLSDIEAGDLIFNFNFSRSFFKYLDTGLNLKYIRTELGDNSLKSVSFDSGLIFSFKIPAIEKKEKNLNLGFSLINFQKFTKEKSSLSSKLKAGFEYTIFENEKFKPKTVFEWIYDKYNRFALGFDLFLLKYYNLRVGYNFDKFALYKLCYGIGICEEKESYNLIFDYSYINLGFETSHIFSVKLEVITLFKEKGKE